VSSTRLPSFDLVVATVDRVEELRRLLQSLAAQTHDEFRVLLVDQNEDDRLVQVLEGYPFEIVRLEAARGLSRARNAALTQVRANLVAFPDDDCTFDPQLLEQVARRFGADAGLAGLTGRAVDETGRSSPSWSQQPALLDRAGLWNRAISFTIFLRASVVRMVGTFDEELGLGSTAGWSSGEEIDYLVRAVDAGARIEYDPSIVVTHPGKQFSPSALRTIAARDGASIGYILRKHRYPKTTVARMLIRPLGGALLALVRRDRAQAGFHLSTFRGRLLGYRP
jgi:glycosyltransferase involved in cell wall biosynthesis